MRTATAKKNVVYLLFCHDESGSRPDLKEIYGHNSLDAAIKWLRDYCVAYGIELHMSEHQDSSVICMSSRTDCGKVWWITKRQTL